MILPDLLGLGHLLDFDIRNLYYVQVYGTIIYQSHYIFDS